MTVDRAILHVDGDAFFVGCEVARNPSLRGRPVVTGRERGIASAVSYEAKARGVVRGMHLGEVKRVCPDVIVLSSDYETYSLFSERMYALVRRYTPVLEEYSIDECFADLAAGQEGASFEWCVERAKEIKRELARELGMIFSVGLASTKVLSKVGSKKRKPDGFLAIQPNAEAIAEAIRDFPAEKVWGIGPATTIKLAKLGIVTAGAFAALPLRFVEEHFTKPIVEVWYELRGTAIYAVDTKKKRLYKSVGKGRTFTPPTSDPVRLRAELSRNAENACIKLRRHDLLARKVYFLLKTQEFRYFVLERRLPAPTDVPYEVIRVMMLAFHEVFRAGERYRGTEVVLGDIIPREADNADLFGGGEQRRAIGEVLRAVDTLDRRFGKHTVYFGGSASALRSPQHAGARGRAPERMRTLFRGEDRRKRLGIPFLGEVK